MVVKKGLSKVTFSRDLKAVSKWDMQILAKECSSQRKLMWRYVWRLRNKVEVCVAGARQEGEISRR